MNRRHAFLNSALGADGLNALSKATKANPDLNSAILARSILSWLNIISRVGYSGSIPGNNIDLTLKKSDQTFYGTITIAKDVLAFKNANLNHVAGSIAIALGLDTPISKQVPSEHLTALGKSLDLLVKAHFVSTHKPVMAPKEPVKLVKSLSRLPRAKKLIKIDPSSLLNECGLCKSKFFKNEQFVGCHCLSDLAKNVNLLRKNGQPVLTFSSNLDQEAVLTILEALKVK